MERKLTAILSADVKGFSRELGARYVVEGSVRRAAGCGSRMKSFPMKDQAELERILALLRKAGLK